MKPRVIERVSCPLICAVRALALATIVLSVRIGATPVEKGDASPGGLVFSAPPTTEELFRAHVFEEPLVPIGGDPSASQNAALAVALGGYAHRSGPDDFSS